MENLQRLVWAPTYYYRAHKMPQTVTWLDSSPSYPFRDIFVITLPSVPLSSKWPSDTLCRRIFTPLGQAQFLWFDLCNNFTYMGAENTELCGPAEDQNSWRIRTDDEL
jgi:hypothetical protein